MVEKKSTKTYNLFVPMKKYSMASLMHMVWIFFVLDEISLLYTDYGINISIY